MIRYTPLRCSNSLIWLLCIGLASKATAQQKTWVTGQVLSIIDSVPISDALIVTEGGQSALTNFAGVFKLYTTIPVSFHLTHLSYTGRFLIQDTIQRKYYLIMETYPLKEAEVLGKYNRLFFDQKFINDPLPPDTSMILRESLMLNNVDRTTMTPGVVIPGPITYLYNQFSKEAKFKKQYKKLMAYDEEVRMLRLWMTQDRLSEWLGTDDSAQLECFFLFCSFHPSVVKRWTEIMFLEQVTHCVKEFDPSILCDWPDLLYFPH